MGSASGAFSGRPAYSLNLSTSLVSQDVNSNTSTLAWSLSISGPTGSFNLNNTSTWSINIDGQTASGTYSYDFRSTTSKALGSGYVTITHNPDGTRSYGASASSSASTPLGTAGASFSEGLPTIPRASTCSFSPTPMVAGSPVTINTNRASSSFTHTISYSFGSQSGVVDSGVGASTSWTPPLSLLTEIPNSMSGAGTLTTQTYSGATLIGTTATPFNLQVPAGAVPTIGSITKSEAVSAVASTVGAYVQSLSKLTLGIVSALGAYGSTITAYKLQVDGQTINAASGTTGVLASSGVLTITATVTDSRGQVGSLTTTLTVLPYAPPTINTGTLTIQRAFANGTLNDQGTYIKVALSAAVTSLLAGTEKNALSYRISARAYGATVYVLQATATPGGITFSGSQLVGTFDIAHSWDILVEVSDAFSTTAVTRTVATAAIFQHWDASVGMGLGKYRENGMLDVAGAIYQNNGRAVIDTVSMAAAITAAAESFHGIVSGTWTKYGAPSVVLDDATIVSAKLSYVPQPGQAVLLQRVGATYWIIGPDYAAAPLPISDKLTLLNGWLWYHDVQALGGDVNNLYSPPIAYRSTSGFVQVHGLLHAYYTGVVAANTVLVNLPAPYRPLQRWRGLVWATGNQIGIIVETNGDVKIETAAGANYLVSLSGIKFNNDPALARTAMTLLSPWIPMGGVEGTPRYAVDSTGRVLLEGAVKGGTAASDAWTPPAAARFSAGGALTHSWDLAITNRMGRVDMPSGPVASPYNLKLWPGAPSTGRSLDLDYVKDGVAFTNVSFSNSWVDYQPGVWNGAQYTKLSDNVAKMRGLIRSGTLSAAATQVPLSYAPKYRLLFYAEASDAPGRIDVDPIGEVIPMAGTTTFVSLEGLEWPPKDFTP